MMNIKNKIGEIFESFTGKLQDFFAVNKKLLLIAASCTVFILIITIVLIVTFSQKGKKGILDSDDSLSTDLSQTKPFTFIDPNVFWLLEEPLKLPPIQFSREQRKIWDKGEIEFWYEPPSSEAMEKLNKKNKKIIENILEEAP
ncbi:hypothetical protein [Treponema pedis]|uniref:Uncharacterized protein n=1 Tax=Treponema pedis TaxID=409322 RepID=A0A7S6WRB6_9SPIR|nr:hypothetical protein [Treponema pedis]QOW61901.1 hypothetical protein IFE08_05975 [Treponema pedis]